MKKSLSRLPAAAVTALVCAALAAWPPSGAGAGSSAAYTSAQASGGAKEYAKSCAMCHGAHLQGTSAPSLRGKTSGIAQQSVAQVYSYMSQQMPLTKPAGLSSTQYLNIMSYILKENGHPAGSKKLTVATARANSEMLEP